MKNKIQNFQNKFQPELMVHSPGRINFIGEHTDYNNGFVLPTAINKKIKFYLRRNNNEHNCTIYSKNYDALLEIDLNNLEISANHWENYMIGVLAQLIKNGASIQGFDCIIESDLPIGSGISSSAALECGLALGLNTLFQLNFSNQELIMLCQKAEHNYVGTKCGIMDQYASVMSRAGSVLLLDCKTQRHRYINGHFDPYVIVLLNTNVTHKLADSEYNKRREECEAVVSFMSNFYKDISTLRDVTAKQLNSIKNELNPVLYDRASFIIQENERVLMAASALEEGNLSKMGRLMYESHKGLRNQYHVSCDQLDFLVDFSQNYNSVIGSRMMGGGFGGCTINLIHKEKVNDYIKEVKFAYESEFGIALTSYITMPSGGTQIEKLSI